MEQPPNSSGNDERNVTATPIVPAWFVLATAGLVMLLFAISYTVDMLSASYSVPAPIYGLVTMVVAAVLGSEAVKGMRK